MLETLPGAVQLPQGLTQPGIVCQHKIHQRPDTAPPAHRSYTQGFGVFLVSREWKEVRKRMFPALMSFLGFSDSRYAIPWKAELCGYRQGGWGTGMVTGSS